MKTTRALTILAALTIAWGVGGAAAAPLLSDASLICAQTPASTAGDAANSQITPDDPNVGTTHCGDLCKKWVSACKSVVAGMAACWKKAVSRVASVRNATCNTLPDPGPCKEAVKAEKDAAKTFIKTDTETGRGFCEANGFATCILNCS
jgi:hypothetical protein